MPRSEGTGRVLVPVTDPWCVLKVLRHSVPLLSALPGETNCEMV